MARTVSGDVSSTPIWLDEQWEAILEICSVTRIISTVSTVYYRPYEAAARYLLSADVISQRTVGDISETYLSPLDLIDRFREMQGDLDALIPLGDDTTGITTLRLFVGGWE